jgi:hypothetical protein
MVVAEDGGICGCTWLAGKRWSNDFAVFQLDLYPPVNWQTAMPSVLRAVRAQAEQTPTVKPAGEPFDAIALHLGRAHPAYEVMGETLAPQEEPLYAWYLRVPDVPAFIRHISAVLEERLHKSILTGYTGELKFAFYRGGLLLLFGYRSLPQLRATFPDVWANAEASLLINILFPMQPSTVHSLDNT